MQLLLLLGGFSSLGAVITTVATFIREHRKKATAGSPEEPTLTGPMRITITDDQGHTVNIQANSTSAEAEVGKLVKNLKKD